MGRDRSSYCLNCGAEITVRALANLGSGLVFDYECTACRRGFEIKIVTETILNKPRPAVIGEADSETPDTETEQADDSPKADPADTETATQTEVILENE